MYTHRHSMEMVGVIATTTCYPQNVAEKVLHQICDDKYLSDPERLKQYFETAQGPENVDSILKIGKELGETRVVLRETIKSVLNRGENIRDLVAKSDGLAAGGKQFKLQVSKLSSLCSEVKLR